MVDRSSVTPLSSTVVLRFIENVVHGALRQSVLMRCLLFTVRADYAMDTPAVRVTVVLSLRGDTRHMYCYRAHIAWSDLQNLDHAAWLVAVAKSEHITQAFEEIWADSK